MQIVKVISVLLCVLCAAPCLGGRRPQVENAPKFARWLMSEGSWGVLATLSEGAPFGYVVSYSDAGTGVPYFYLSSLDPAGKDVVTDSRACFSLSERAIDDCNGYDPQSPNCSKLSLSGQLLLLSGDSSEGAGAEAALFADHPQFKQFPKYNNTFSVYKLQIESIFLVNKPAPPRAVTVPEYFNAGT